MSNLYLHDSIAPSQVKTDQFSNLQLYGENNVSKRALVNIESYLMSNLGFFSLCNQREVIEDDGEPPERIFYFGS